MNDLVEGRGTSIDTLRSAAPATGTAMMKAEGDRAIAEVQAAMVIAKRFPRDEQAAYTKIIKACKRATLAEAALYAYTKGGSEVSGPSIRLAEELARDWGNISFGWKILSQDDESSEVRAEAWDLETNVPAYITFTVRHEFKAHGKIKQVTDPREVYELIANQASRRLRACILRVIPGDIQDAAIEQCEKTLKDGGGKPLSDRVRDMLTAFQNDHGVSKEMIEKKVGKKPEAINETELVNLRRIYVSLRDGMAKVDEFFDQSAGQGATSAEDLKKETEKSAAAPASAGTASSSTIAAERPAASASAAGQTEEKPKTPLPESFHVVTERGRVFTTIAYRPKIGEILEFDGLPWRVIEITDRVIVKAGEKAPEHPQPKPPAQPEELPVTVDQVTAEIMGAESQKDLDEARELIKRLPEKDRATVTAVAGIKENQLKGNKPPAKKRSTGSIE
jgi:hypothetical protein